ncbi:MAG: hypothetical protein JRJ84_05935 [Deltaproteobacteria bacterium]|nr:hypothetical protein [Deltaproteobacteria bacterium]
MPLPVFPGLRRTDIAVSGWAAITVRVVWALLCDGVRLNARVLRDARDHVLYHLDPATPLCHAEDQADNLTRQFVAQARRVRRKDPWPQDAVMPLSPRWRRALENSLTPLTMAMFRQHYGDARPLPDLELTLQVDRIALEGARGGLREMVRRAACADGLPVEDWHNDRLDRLLRRLAAFAPGQCPALEEVLRGAHHSHVVTCPRCTRTLRLVRANLLTPADLEPPLGSTRPNHRATVLALHFHPDGRHHREALAKEARLPSSPVGDDLLLVDWADPEAATDLLLLATQVGRPKRDHLRGVVLEGPGRWTPHGLLGPLASEADHAVRSRSWGTVDALGELPGVLPSPPSARQMWVGVAALGLLALLTVRAARQSPAPDVDHPLEVEFSPGRGGIWSEFDVEEGAYVTLVREADGVLDVVLASHDPADKAGWAVGDGSYRVHTMGSGVLLVSSAQPLPPLGPVMVVAGLANDPLAEVEARIRRAAPRADLRARRRP